MSYYDDYPEPTDEDYCTMQGHLTEPDPNGGWNTCFCRYIVEPPYGEPHDEYSAYHADLRDEYIDLIFNTSRDVFGVPLKSSSRVLEMNRELSKLSTEQLRELIEITRNSDPDCFDYTKDVEDIITIGVHLDHNGESVINDIVKRLTSGPNLLDHRSGSLFMHYSSKLVNPEHLRLARVAAKFYSLLHGSRISYHYDEKKEMVEFISSINVLLDEHPDKAHGVASLVNARGISPETTELVMAILNGEIEASPTSLSAGLI